MVTNSNLSGLYTKSAAFSSIAFAFSYISLDLYKTSKCTLIEASEGKLPINEEIKDYIFLENKKQVNKNEYPKIISNLKILMDNKLEFFLTKFNLFSNNEYNLMKKEHSQK
jgi:hypothetical protein